LEEARNLDWIARRGKRRIERAYYLARRHFLPFFSGCFAAVPAALASLLKKKKCLYLV